MTSVIRKAAALAVASGLIAAAAAHAHPCGPAEPVVGAVIHGPVLKVVDSSHICVATAAARADWVELLIKGADEGPAVSPDRLGPALLMSVAFARTADCTVGVDASGRKVADCRIDGQPIQALLHRPGAVEAANAWIARSPAADAPTQLASR
jgi:hypothetical protein